MLISHILLVTVILICIYRDNDTLFITVYRTGVSDVFTSLQKQSQRFFQATMEPRAPDSGSGPLLFYQIQNVHSCNEYSESPTTCPCPQISGSTTDECAVLGQDDHTQDSLNQKATAVEEHPRNTSKQKVLELGERFSPGQRCLESGGDLDVAIKEQPRSCNLKQEKMMLLESASTDEKPSQFEPKQKTTKQYNRKHPSPCDQCSRCRCKNCVVVTSLPVCWLCGDRCLCSAEAVVEYTTFVCCLKALLYHCSSDDEDASADAPFSCHKSRRCRRWSTVAAMAFVLPCLLCYGPARGCLALCQLCYDHSHRSGCRCKGQHVTHNL